jgi:hypothetical protein
MRESALQACSHSAKFAIGTGVLRSLAAALARAGTAAICSNTR